jgi:RNA-directed DNA polymerase
MVNKSLPTGVAILLFKAQVEHGYGSALAHNYAFKAEVIFCVSGVASPILSNLFMHYAFDLWMARTHSDLPWCRYADDGLVHCRTEQEAEALKAELQARLEVCGLQMHPTKTHIVYCKDYRRRGTYPIVKFDFLGYQFRPRQVASSQGKKIFCGYTPAVSPTALKSMRATIRSLHIPRQTPGTLAELARQLNPLLRGWIAYYGRFSRSALWSLVDYVNQKLKAWIRRKYKRFRLHKTRASEFLRKWARDNAELFVHWQVFGTATLT